MKPFNLEEYLANTKKKVVTRGGAVVEIICTNGRGPLCIIGYIDDHQTPSFWCSDGHFIVDGETTSSFDLFFADEEEPINRLPSWHRAKAGTKLPSEAVIIYAIDPEPRLGKVMVNDGRYMLVKEVEELPEQKEQKPAEWSDSVAKEMFIKALERAAEQTKKGYELTDCDKQSWWEDFKAYSLRPQPHWKPSEKQMEKLFSIIAELRKIGHNDIADFLASLYGQLKKLI